MKTGTLTELTISEGGARDRLRNDMVSLPHGLLGDEYADDMTDGLIAIKA